MSAAVSVPITHAQLSERPDEIVIGKDILELLAGAMYADPLTIYREYIQNAADSIDAAREDGDQSTPFGVTIFIDRAARTVRIRDNGASIKGRDFVRVVTSIGASGKRGNKNRRGFRGVGRLSGLGYCQEVIFRGCAEGETSITEVRWDGRKLREKLREVSFSGGLSDLVRETVDIRRMPGDAESGRFFEVELRKVSRLRGDLLLNDESIRSYLSQVAPVPFHPDFKHGDPIVSFLRERGVREPIEIRIDGDEHPITHRLRTEVEFSPKLSDRFETVEWIELRGQDGDLDAFGWVLDHAYIGAMPKSLGIGGIRLRAGNVQVGNELILAPLYPEQRFASWAVGEIHIASPKILPNARRDEFEASTHYAHLQDEISIIARRIAQIIRDRSIGRNRMRRIHENIGFAEQWLDEAKGTGLPPTMRRRVREMVDQRLVDAGRHLDRLPGERDDVIAMRDRLKHLSTQATRTLGKNDGATPKARSARDKAIEVALTVVLENAPTPQTGLLLSRRILSAYEDA